MPGGHTEQRGSLGKGSAYSWWLYWNQTLPGLLWCKNRRKIVLRFSRQSGGQSSRGKGQDWLTHSRVTARIRSTTILLNCSNQKMQLEELETASLFGFHYKMFFLLTGLGSIMPKILPNNYNVLKASIWKPTISPNPLNIWAVVYSTLLIKIYFKTLH